MVVLVGESLGWYQVQWKHRIPTPSGWWAPNIESLPIYGSAQSLSPRPRRGSAPGLCGGPPVASNAVDVVVEAGELLTAIRDMLRDGATIEEVRKTVEEAKDVIAAVKRLAP